MQFCLTALLTLCLILHSAHSQNTRDKLVLCESKERKDFAMSYCSYQGLCVEYKDHPVESRQCICYDDYVGHKCGTYSPKSIRPYTPDSIFTRLLNVFKTQQDEVTDDRFLFIAILMFSNTVIMLFGIFISYQKTKRWNYNRADETMT